MSKILRDSAGRSIKKTLLLMQKGKQEEALKELEQAEEAARKAKAEDIFLYVLTIKGRLMRNLGAYEEALKIHTFCIKSTEELLSKDPDNKPCQSNLQMNLDSIGTLGNLFYNMGRFPQAKSCYELNLSIFQKLLKTDPENLAHQSYFGATLNNLGILLKDMGRIEEAKEKYEKALEMSQKLLETDPKNVVYLSNVAGVLSNLGNLYLDIGLIEETKDKYEKALDICEKILKTNPEKVAYQSDVAMTLNNLGTLLYDMGRRDEAKENFEKALEIYEMILKIYPNKVEYQSYTGAILNNLSALLSNTGFEEEAITKYEKALTTRQKLLEIDPENLVYQSNLAITLNNLGNLLFDLGCNEKAKEKYERALEIFTEPMQYLTISTKSYSIIKLIGLNSKQAENESNLLNKTNFFKEVINLCKKYRDFFIKYELNHERKLVTEAGLKSYIDLSMVNVIFERDSGKKAKQYEQALQAVEKLGEIEDDETVLKLYSSAIYYLRGRKLVNEALTHNKPDLELLRQAVEQFRNARETYNKADLCFCVYIGLLKILEKVENFEEVDVPELKKLVQEVVETLPDDVYSSIRSSFENIPQIFEENDIAARKELLINLDEEIGNIEYKALGTLFRHIGEKIKDSFEEPFNLTIFYDNWRLKVVFDDVGKIKGKLTVKADNKTLLNRNLTPVEVKNKVLEIDYLDKKYFPQGEDEISFTMPEQRKPVVRPIDYFESIGKDNKTRILQFDCCNDTSIDSHLQVAAVQLKYNVYSENSVVKLTVDESYYQKVMAILDAVKDEADIVVFPEFSIPFETLKGIQEFADENGIIIVAGSHYVTEGQLGEYGKFFSREFGEEDLRKNISPVLIPSLKIIHNEKLLGAREERELYFNEGMKAGKVNHIFKLRDDLRLGLMICYEYLNADLRNRLIPACDVILVPQTNPNPERFYETAKADINNPLCSGNKAYIMANGIFTLGEDKQILGGSTGIVSTLDKYSYKRQDEAIIKPVDEVMEQFVLLTSINTGFNPARDTWKGQVPLKTKIIHIFEENEVISSSANEGRKFIQVLEKIKNCRNKEELKEILSSEENKEVIKAFSPLMNKHIEDLRELTFEEMKKKCCSILIPAK